MNHILFFLLCLWGENEKKKTTRSIEHTSRGANSEAKGEIKTAPHSLLSFCLSVYGSVCLVDETTNTNIICLSSSATVTAHSRNRQSRECLTMQTPLIKTSKNVRLQKCFFFRSCVCLLICLGVRSCICISNTHI